jgi:hypothetical protein
MFRTVALIICSLVAFVSQASAQFFSRRTALLPDPTINSILEETSGENALRHLAMIAHYSRFPGSRGYHHAVEYIVQEAKAAGLQQVQVHRFPGEEVGWDPVEGRLELVSPESELITDVRDVGVAVAQGSHDADITAELVDVGSGSLPEDYEGKDVRGKIVLTSSYPMRAQAEAIFKRGAAGIVSSYRGNFYGLLTPENVPSWGSIAWKGPNGEPGGFGFCISPHQGDELRMRLARKEKVIAHARVRAMVDETPQVEMVTAVLPGQDIQDEDIVLTAHLDHQLPSANDNASGSAALLEIARVLKVLRNQNKIPPLRRNVRFWWVSELLTTQAYIFEHPDEGAHLLLNINMDQAGGDRLGRNDFVFQAALRVAPSFLNALMDNFGQYAMRNLAPVNFAASSLFVAPTGTRDPFVIRFWKDDDEKPTTDSFAFLGLQIAGVNIAVPSFNLIHSGGDTVDRIDPTQLKRSCYLVLAPAIFLATMKPEQAPALANATLAFAIGEIGYHLDKAFSGISAATDLDFTERYSSAADRIRDSIAYEVEVLDSVQPLAEQQPPALEYVRQQRDGMKRLGPIYEELLKAAAQARAAALHVALPSSALSAEAQRLADEVPVLTTPMGQRDKKIYDFHADGYPQWYGKHLINNQRSVVDIYRAIHAFYPDYKFAQLQQYLGEMEKQGLIKFVERTPSPN